MNPPPPTLPASGHVTASANPTATAASTALPPRLRTARPTSVAAGDTDTTTPFVAATARRAGACAAADGRKAASAAR